MNTRTSLRIKIFKTRVNFISPQKKQFKIHAERDNSKSTLNATLPSQMNSRRYPKNSVNPQNTELFSC